MNAEELGDWILNPVTKFVSYDVDFVLAKVVELIKHNILYNNIGIIHIYEYYDLDTNLSYVNNNDSKSLYINCMPKDKFLNTLLPILQDNFPSCKCEMKSETVVNICCYKLGMAEFISLQFRP